MVPVHVLLIALVFMSDLFKAAKSATRQIRDTVFKIHAVPRDLFPHRSVSEQYNLCCHHGRS